VGQQILSVPFRLTPNGAAATVDQDSDEADAEQIGVLIATRIGERRDAPGFGIPNPVFVGVDPGAITNGVALYGPPVQIDDIKVTYPDELTQQVTVDFT
jgi:hypothetical protein